MEMTLERPGQIGPETIYAAPSNYHRNSAAPGDMVFKGREFIISKDDLNATSFTKIRRGDRLVGTELGRNTIIEVIEIIVFNKLIGYRVRTE